MATNKTIEKMKAKVEQKTKVVTGYENKLYQVIDSPVPKSILKKRNKSKNWKTGWDPEYNFVNISTDGTIGEFYWIQGLIVAIPEPSNVYSRSEEKEEQYWEVEPSPDDRMMKKMKSIKQLQFINTHKQNEWKDFIVQEWDRREDGFWFMNEGKPTYVTGSHYFFMRWAKIDIGAPDYRESNRIFWYFWEACKVDQRCLGMCYLKNRRSGFSYMAMSETVNLSSKPPNDSQYGMLSKTGADAQSMFTIKCVKIANNLPFFFMPIRSGEAKPKSEIVFAKPSSKITRKTLDDLDFVDDEEISNEGLDNKVNWKTTNDNSYDGEKLKLLVHDESGKWTAPNNINNNWQVTKTCLITGSKVIGKCMMGSTSNKLKDGGENFKLLYEDSDLRKTVRENHGQTASGLYSLFIPMEWNIEGKIDIYGKPVFNNPEKPRPEKDGWIAQGAIEWWDEQVKTKKNNPASQNEHIRQFPRTENHAFRDEIHGALFNIVKINNQIDHNDALDIPRQQVVKGMFQWQNGVPDTIVEWVPREDGRFRVCWLPPVEMQNRFKTDRNGNRIPFYDELGAFGCDPYDIDGVNYGFGSNGALHGITSNNTNGSAPSMRFFLEYVARPETAYTFFEEVMMASIFYGMPVLIENNKPGISRHFKNRGYFHYLSLRPDRRPHELKPADISLRGIPNTSEDVIQMHASMIQSYIEEYVGEDENGDFGFMPFSRTLNDWLRFELRKRTDYDASISSGLAIMAIRKHHITPHKPRETKVISVPFGTFDNSGNRSRLL